MNDDLDPVAVLAATTIDAEIGLAFRETASALEKKFGDPERVVAGMQTIATAATLRLYGKEATIIWMRKIADMLESGQSPNLS